MSCKYIPYNISQVLSQTLTVQSRVQAHTSCVSPGSTRLSPAEGKIDTVECQSSTLLGSVIVGAKFLIEVVRHRFENMTEEMKRTDQSLEFK